MILRRCPVCEQESIIGHGRRRKQAHDKHHDWIGVRRGRCSICGRTFTSLPLFSLPYTHYSLLARCHALQRRFAEQCSWEKAFPKLKDSDRKVEKADITQALADVGDKVRYNQLRDQIMTATACSKRNAQLAIAEACPQGWIAQANGQYLLPL